MKTRFPDRGDYKAEYLSLVAENVQISPMVLATHLTVLYCGYKGSGQESLNRHIQFWTCLLQHYQAHPFGHNRAWQGFANVWLCSHWPASLSTESLRTLEFTNKSCLSDANSATACIYVRVTFSPRRLCGSVEGALCNSQYSMECFFYDNKKPCLLPSSIYHSLLEKLCCKTRMWKTNLQSQYNKLNYSVLKL